MTVSAPGALAMSVLSLSTSHMRSAEAREMMSVISTMESIIRLESMLMA